MLDFKELEAEDLEKVARVFTDFGADLAKVTKGHRLVGSYGGKLEVFMTTEGTFKTYQRSGRKPYTVGLFLGDIRGTDFLLGLEGASLLGPHTDRKVVVNNRAEQLVLYGRDVLHKSVLKLPDNLKVNERCLIVNENGEVLGIGRLDKDCIRNIKDRGWYLRKGE